MHMKRYVSVLVLLLALALVGTACADDTEEPTGTEAEGENGDLTEGEEPEGGVDAEAVSVGAALAQMRGHHRVAEKIHGPRA